MVALLIAVPSPRHAGWFNGVLMGPHPACWVPPGVLLATVGAKTGLLWGHLSLSCSSPEQVYFGGLCMQEGSRGPEERLFLQAKALEESPLHATSRSWTGVCLTVPRPARGTGPPLP